MHFGNIHRMRFSATDGAYSVVTPREFYDSQITVTDAEAALLINHFKNIHTGNVRTNRQESKKDFLLYPDGNRITLNLVFPKPEKTELRLYLSQKAGFKPKGGYVWFIFLKNNDIWIGAMPEKYWRKENSDFRTDEFEEIYQEGIQELDGIRIQKLKGRDVFVRDRNIALKRMKLAGYRCEYDPAHKLFLSRHSLIPYLEAHHLVPMSIQSIVSKKLDTLDNVFCLCTFCHSAVHHAEEKLARDIICALADTRPKILRYLDISNTELFSYYAVEEII